MKLEPLAILIGLGVVLWLVKGRKTPDTTSMPVPSLPQFIPSNYSPIGFNTPGVYSSQADYTGAEYTGGH